MGVIAKWGPKVFEVNSKRIVPITNLTTGYKLKADSNNDTSGTPPTNTRGRELETVKFDVTYITGVGINVRNEYGAWRPLVGQVHMLIVGGKQYGPPKWQLDSADVKQTLMDTNGNFIKAVVAVTLTEFVASTETKTATSAAPSKTAALSAKPSANDKKNKTPYGTTKK